MHTDEARPKELDHERLAILAAQSDRHREAAFHHSIAASEHAVAAHSHALAAQNHSAAAGHASAEAAKLHETAKH